eukprot:3080600-Pyramimonas_sp.AAC.2
MNAAAALADLAMAVPEDPAPDLAGAVGDGGDGNGGGPLALLAELAVARPKARAVGTYIASASGG